MCVATGILLIRQVTFFLLRRSPVPRDGEESEALEGFARRWICHTAPLEYSTRSGDHLLQH